MTPDGTPVVGPTSIRNLYLNTGHGTLGWTMACGSARVLSDQISETAPEIEADDLAISRYSATSRHGRLTTIHHTSVLALTKPIALCGNGEKAPQ